MAALHLRVTHQPLNKVQLDVRASDSVAGADQMAD
jgi:hypothetical protein